MSAYKMALSKPKCVTCGATARFEVFNTWNGSVGKFCGTHAEVRLRELRAGEATGNDGRLPEGGRS